MINDKNTQRSPTTLSEKMHLKINLADFNNNI